MIRHVVMIAALVALGVGQWGLVAQAGEPATPDPRLIKVNQYIAKGEQAFREGEVEKGIEAFQKAIELETRRDHIPGWHLTLGRYLAEAKRPKEAIAAYEKAVDTAQHVSQKVLAYTGLGPLYEETGDGDRAVEAYKFVLENEKMPAERDKAALSYYKALQKTGRLVAVLGELWNRVEKNPKDKEALEKLFFVHAKATGNNEELIKTLEHLRPLDPDNEEYLSYLAGLYEKHKRYDEAIEVLQHMAKISAEDRQPYLLSQAARVMAKAGHLDRAIATLEDLVKQKPDINTFRIQLAQTYADADRFEDAEKQYLVVIEREPGVGPTTLWLELGELYVRFDRIEKAEDAFAKALKTTNEVEDLLLIHKRIMGTYLMRKREKEADQWAQKLRDLHASPDAGIIAVAEVYYVVEQRDRAVDYLEKGFWSLEGWPERERLFNSFALLCERMKCMERAATMLEKVIQDPATPKQEVAWANEMLPHVRKYINQ